MMLARKLLNASDLFWDSLDAGERTIVLYAAAWIVLAAALTMQRRSRERFRRDLLAELEAANSGSR
jgi:hypothetical protein